MKQYWSWHSQVQIRMWNEFCDSAQKLNNSLFRSSFDSHRKNSIPSYEFQNLIFFLNLSSLSIWLFDSIIITPIQLVNNTFLYFKCAISPYYKLSHPSLKYLCLLTYTIIFINTVFFRILTVDLNIYGHLCLNPVMHFNENTNMYI